MGIAGALTLSLPLFTYLALLLSRTTGDVAAQRSPARFCWLPLSLSPGPPSQADPHFMNDTGLSFPEMQAFHAAYARNMETLYDNIVEQGG